MKITVKNKRDNSEVYELTLDEFKSKFQKELNSAINAFTEHEKRKDLLQPWKLTNFNKDYKTDFYQDLRWNFNTNAPTVYYIDRIK